MKRRQRFNLAAALLIAVLALPAFARADDIGQQPNSAQLASDRYQCDIWAVDQTGFDPIKDDGGVPPEAVSAKRAEYLRAEAVCFQARGYVVRTSAFTVPRLVTNQNLCLPLAR